ncbi:MAG: hypothetical protein WD071_03630 [Pseudohongiella sp.]|uniref:hypothetical protein n=1 Tax=Pseudohongiella sp. TaxID=1979412 RepID=UPI0034A00D3A
MPKAILALRSYPLAILMALVLFVCSFLIATSSIGTIGNGGDDQGSGMGGTGRTGGFNGDSGFGGTGGPSPFLGSNDAVENNDASENNNDINTSAPDSPPDSLIAPFLQQQQETARIPDDMQPLIELQRNSPQSPEFQPLTPRLDILDAEREEMPEHAHRVLEMAESSNRTIEEPTLEIQVQIPEATGTDAIERYRMDVADQAAPEPAETDSSGVDTRETADAPLVLEQLNADEIAENDTDTAADAQLQELDAGDSSRPLIPERIQRPELPPFQRMRPAVDRASITPPRPRPMQI